MAREAARLLEGCGWLPEPLRSAADEASADNDEPDNVAAKDEVDGATAELPAYLADDGEGDDIAGPHGDTDQQPHLDAAE